MLVYFHRKHSRNVYNCMNHSRCYHLKCKSYVINNNMRSVEAVQIQKKKANINQRTGNSDTTLCKNNHDSIHRHRQHTKHLFTQWKTE